MSEASEESDQVEEAELIARVRDGDLEACVVYADWLEERGHLDRAMLLRSLESGSGSPMSRMVELFRWLHDLGDIGDPDEVGVFQVAPGCGAFTMGSDISIQPGARAVMVTRPQVSPILPTQIVIPESIAGQFSIANIRVGNRRQIEGPDPIPASLFTPSSIAGHRGRISFHVVNTAQDFAIEAQNTSDRECAFFALVFCRVPADAADTLAAPAILPRELSASEVAEIVRRVRASAGET